MNTREQRYENVLKFLARENIPEGFGGLALDLHDYAYRAAMDRTGLVDVDDVTEDDYLEGLLLLVEAAIGNEEGVK